MTYKEFGATIAPANKSDTGFPIVMGSHVGGGRTINNKINLKLWQLLGDGADLTEQKANAIGQIWYDRYDSKYYKLTGFVGDTPQWVEFLDFATSTHNHNATYLGISAQASDSAKLGGQLPSYYEPAFNKNTAFNKDFGTGSSDVARGDHSHSDLHSHSNKAILDSISAAFTTTLKTSYDDAVSNSHTHSNKTTLDAITAAFTTALKTNYDSAYTNSHTHSNKATLDLITAAFTTSLKTSYDGAVSNSHTHSNKSTLDAITAAFTTALKTSYDGAVTNSHTHSNKTVLDALTQAIIDNSHTHSNSTALGNVSGSNTGDETAQRIGILIDEATEKTTPVDDDMVGLMDSAASKIMKKLSWASIKTKLKAYFDTMYATLSFSKIRVGGVDIVPSTYDDRIEFIAGTNVTLTPDTGGKKLTIAAAGGGSSSQVQVDFNITDVADVRHILNKPAENRTVSNRISTLVNRKFQVNPGTASGNYNEGIRIANSSQGYSLIALGADATLDTGVNADGNQWHIIKYPSGDIAICQGSDMSTGLSMEKGGDIYWRNTKLNSSGGSIAYMGNLEDLENSIDLQRPGMHSGIWTLIPGQSYTNAPNPICGTDADSSNLAGTYTYVSNSEGGTWTYHDQNTNKMYISSWYTHPVKGLILKPWERLLTCMDEPQTIQADIEAESIYHLPIPATGTTDYTFYLNGFDGKNGNKIEIDLATIAGSVNMNKRVVEICVSPAQPNIDVSFYCAGLNSFTPTASYTDPLLVSGNIYYMKFIFLNQTTYWSVDNNIAYF